MARSVRVALAKTRDFVDIERVSLITQVPTLAIMFQKLWTSKLGRKKAKIAATGLRPTSEKTKDLVLLTELIEAGS